ncbi:glycoside hydrolase [Paenibacillus protaetiae]|uniref:Glycoside hydrolase n=2 Tax=Paenibacillus protaetiae TaxID=2509456 RepID=A0A4P6FCV4_9BACL|nr:glycoside hydrolase [Paenibacillus protaetiae]
MPPQLQKILIALLMIPLLGTAAPTLHAAASAATNYRVYQNDKPLKEFAAEQQAIAYAKGYAYSHVEQITGRAWVWDNFPRYKIYQAGTSKTAWEYRTYSEALAAASKMSYVHIRDLQQPGWVYNSYPHFQLYQGTNTKNSWGFATLAAAKQEAKKWGNAHIIDLDSNTWVWDNLTAQQKTAQRAGSKNFVIVKENISGASDSYSFLYDAIQAANASGSANVYDTSTGKVVFSSYPTYDVLQNGKPIQSLISLTKAVAYAQYYANSEVVHNGETWWTNIPYLTVLQNGKKINAFSTREAAVSYAKGYANSAIQTADGRMIWSNAKSLVYLGWNGEVANQTVLAQASATQSLSIDSPTWFQLAASDGSLTDTSDGSVAKQLKDSGIQVTPLVHNQFDKAMTTAFLKNKAAQTSFINALTAKLVSLGVYGVNLDFENMAGSDRAAFTAFVSSLAKAVHDKGLKLSIDLPRGDKSWNAQTAIDQQALSGLVDTVIIMAYDEHWSGSDTPGSVAGLAWTEEGIKQYLAYGVPRSKLMLGIPFYVREWQLDGSGKLISNRAVLMKDVSTLIASTGASGIQDPVSGQTKYTYKKNGYTYMFWAETPETTAARINLAKKYDLAGVAAWRLGYEQPDLWTMMLRMKQS